MKQKYYKIINININSNIFIGDTGIRDTEHHESTDAIWMNRYSIKNMETKYRQI